MNGEQLKRAREIRGLTQTELAEHEDIKVTQAAIARIEQNLLDPSDELVEKLARKLQFPKKFFFELSSFDFPHGSLLFRCLKALRSKERSQIVQTAWAAYKMYDYMAGQLRIDPSTFPRLTGKDVFSTTQILRSALGVEPDKPIQKLINKLERIGVVVIVIPLEIHEHDGFSLWINDRPVMVLSSGKPGDRRRRTAAHEAIHLAIHHTVKGDLDEIETEADEHTNELMTPEDVIAEEIKSPVTLTSLAELKPRWGVSIQSLVERSFELGIISPNQRKYLWKQIGINKWRKDEPNPLEVERPRALQKMAELLYTDAEGIVNYRKLAYDVSLPFDLVRNIFVAYDGFKPEAESRPRVIEFPTAEAVQDRDDSNPIPDASKIRKFSPR